MTDGPQSYPPPPPPPSLGDRGPVPGAAPVAKDTNGFAIASLAVGLLGGSIVAIGLGIVALTQIGKKGQKGRGLAIAGIVAGCLTTLIIGGLVLVTFLGRVDRDESGQVTSGGDLDLGDLEIGDCITETEESESLRTLPVVPCDEPHSGEVYAEIEMAEGDWPGLDEVFRQADSGCADALLDYSATAYEDQDVDIYYVYPTESSWRFEDREIICITDYISGPRTGSLLRD